MSDPPAGLTPSPVRRPGTAYVSPNTVEQPLGRICARGPECVIDPNDGYCSHCRAFLEGPRDRVVVIE